MRNIFFIIVVSLCLSVAGFGQKTVADLKSSHAIALEKFLSQNKDYRFMSSKIIDSEYLKWVREFMGAKFEPYYHVDDFNGDKITDFAMVLSRKGRPTETGATSEEHKYDYPIAVIIFNGQKDGNYKQAFIENLEAPKVCFVNFAGEKKKALYFGVFESDADTIIFTPVGDGYIIENPDSP